MVPMLPSEVGQVDGTFKLTFAAFHFCVTGTVSVHTKDAKAADWAVKVPLFQGFYFHA